MKQEVKYLDKQLLLEANRASIRESRYRVLKEDFFEEHHNDNLFIVRKAFYHRNNEVRLLISPLGRDQEFQLDCSHTRYNSFPFFTLDKNGNKTFHEGVRPYPNEREWQEIERKEPVRKQYLFRKMVLSAYDNTCAVCDISPIWRRYAAWVLCRAYLCL
jgi:putative restriction endonuclease